MLKFTFSTSSAFTTELIKKLWLVLFSCSLSSAYRKPNRLKARIKRARRIQELLPVEQPKPEQPKPEQPGPDHIDSDHWKELVIDSGIDPELASLNIVS